jgi:TonB family protein
MITAWILYAFGVGALVGAGGFALERVFRIHGLPTRWIWVGAVLLSIGWPLGHWAWENTPREASVVASTDLPSVVVPDISTLGPILEPLAVEVPPESVLRLLDGPVLVAWGLLTSGLLLFFVLLFSRTQHLRRRWRTGRVAGQTVLYSDEWGPAVVGFLRPQIVLPRWCQAIDERALRFILDHELEHVRAGDLRLMILAGLFPVFFPWNLPAWWQLARLRTALEADCDLRVLGKNPGQTRSYVDLLLRVGEQSTRMRPPAVMLSEPYETLKRRIKIMTMPLPKSPWIRGTLLAGAGAVLVAVACWAPGPTDPIVEQSLATEPAVSPDEAAGVVAERTRPVFTPYTVLPDVRNRTEVVATLQRDYPVLLKDAGIGGTVDLWFFVNEEGRVQRTQVDHSSGHRAVDDAAIKIADVIEFTPALARDQRKPLWISLPMVFHVGDAEEMDASAVRAAQELAEAHLVEWRYGGRTNAEPSGVAEPNSGQTGQITGTISSAGTGQPLADVQVYVPGTGLGTLTNTDGRFLILDVPAGEYEIVAELVGYGVRSELVTVPVDDYVRVDLDLRLRAIPLTPLVIVVNPDAAGG